MAQGTADINIKFAAAATALQKLTDELKEGQAKIERLDDKAKDLGERAEEETRECCSALDALQKKLEEAQSAHETKCDDLRTKQETLQTRGDEAEKALQTLMNDVKKLMQEMEQHKDQQNQQLNTLHSEAESNAKTYTDNVKDLDDQADTAEQDSDRFVKEFRDHVESAKDDLEKEREDLHQETETFQSAGVSHISELFSTFERVMQQGDSKVTEVQNDLGSMAENVLGNIGQLFMEKALGELGNAFKGLEGAFDALDMLSGASDSSQGGALGMVMGLVEPMEVIKTIVEPIAAIFDAVM